jgi:acetyl esterase/lipase
VSAALFSALAFSKRKIPVVRQELQYGAHRDERLDYLPAENPDLKPQEAVIYIHGGGWISCNKRLRRWT